AEREFIRGKDLNPGNAYSLHWHAHYLEAMGRMTEAATEMNRSREMDPLSSMLLLDSALQQAYFRQWDKALQMLDRIAELEPAFPFANLARGNVFLGMGKRQDALDALDKVQPAASGVPFVMGLLGALYGQLGAKDEARKQLSALEAMAGKSYVSPFYFASIYLGLGDSDAMFRALDQAYEQRSSSLFYLAYEPMWAQVRSHPRGAALLKKIGLPGA
ncbi:MAG: hypothetical protein HYR60_32240, partial [Acidobacteria bacterium]|nr:hypothetical protein [Acidobacteriota bacterium]